MTALRQHLIDSHRGMVLNKDTALHDVRLYAAVGEAASEIEQRTRIRLAHSNAVYLNEGNGKRHIRPDGGVLFIYIDGHEMPIAGFENKRQGYQHGPRTRGNAIERMGKHILFFQTLFEHEAINPYTAFCWGTDFEDGSPVLNTLVSLAQVPDITGLNCVNVNKRSTGLGGPSIFYNDKVHNAFTKGDLKKLVTEVTTKSLDYFINKYGNNVQRL